MKYIVGYVVLNLDRLFSFFFLPVGPLWVRRMLSSEQSRIEEIQIITFIITPKIHIILSRLIVADIRDAFIVFSAKFYEKALNGKATVPRLWEAEWQRRSVWRTTERTTGTELQQTNSNLGFIVHFQLIFKCGKSHGTKSGKEPNPLGWSFSLTCVVDVSTNPFLFMISTKERKKTEQATARFYLRMCSARRVRARACVCEWRGKSLTEHLVFRGEKT